MMMKLFQMGILAGATSVLAAFLGCAAGAGDMESGGDSYADVDADSDSDGDADSDSDADTDTDTGAPEEEAQYDYRVPMASGRYVFVADRIGDTVVVVDSETLSIDITEVGATPTHLVPLGDDGEIAVLSLDADEVTILRMDDSGGATTTTLDVRPDTNALAVSENGRFVVAFWDDLFSEESGPPGTDQEISVLDTLEGNETAYEMAVGMHPQQVLFSADSTRAFVVTEEGINIVELDDLANEGLPAAVELFGVDTVDPSMVEVIIDPAGTVAVGRQDGSAELAVTWLDGSDEWRTYTMPSTPTDIDISADGSFGMVVLRASSQVAFFDLPLPDDPAIDPFLFVDLGDRVCGVATLADSSNAVLLYTTNAGDEADRRTLTTLTRGTFEWEIDSIMMERTIDSVRTAPGGDTAIVMHDYTPVSAGEFPNSYSLLKIDSMQTKFQMVPAAPGHLLMTSDGDFGYLLVRDDGLSIKRTDVINLNSFIVDSIELGSPPVASGYAPVTDKVFVSQDHPAGRMTFIGVHDDSIKTVTGYVLNDEITD